MKNLILIIFLNISFGIIQCLDICGDWSQYKDIKCIKVLEKKGTQEEASKNCTQFDHSSSLLTIHSKDEQEFLNNLLTKYSNISLNAWIGMKYLDKNYKWTDETETNFTNWADDAVKDGSDPCVEMSLKENIGKWNDQSCKRIALIVCQKKQEFNLNTLRNSLEIHDKIVKTLENEIALLKTNPMSISIPVGFLYTQFPNQSAPQDLWPNLKWIEVTKNYPGLFFRAEGPESEPFGKIQQANQSWISDVYHHGCYWGTWARSDCEHELHTPMIREKWAELVKEGDSVATAYFTFFTTGGETRPKNTAIKIWKRI